MTTAAIVLIWAGLRLGGSPAGKPQSAKNKLPEYPVSIAGSVVKGNQDAAVAIVEFSDFQCPFCSKFATQTMPLLDQRYMATGRVKLIFKHLPLDKIHALAGNAAAAAECARNADGFWRLHDAFFSRPGVIKEAPAVWAREANLDPKALSGCLDGEEVKQVKADQQQARLLGITSTPTFLIGQVVEGQKVKVTSRLSGALPFDAFEKPIEALLKGNR
ncbi:MAG TPA: thioredoxin domain-containing protein [Vicinamibacterales bacterium]|nr:thioredoxin domain-containing protein [Vicinamibacterales bacterium]